MIVAVDQLMWYCDLAFFGLTWLCSGHGKFIVGVCSYLQRPENMTVVRLATSWHHVWFIPCVFYVRGEDCSDRVGTAVAHTFTPRRFSHAVV